MKKTVFSKFLAVILSLLMSAGVLQTGVPVFAGEEPGGEMITLTFKKDGAKDWVYGVTALLPTVFDRDRKSVV